MKEGFVSIILFICSAWLVLCNGLRRVDDEKESNKENGNKMSIPKLPPVYKNIKAHYVWEKETQTFEEKNDFRLGEEKCLI